MITSESNKVETGAGMPEDAPAPLNALLPYFIKGERVIVAVSVLLLALIYAFLPLGLSGPEQYWHRGAIDGFWAPDSGARFAMIRNWVQYGSLVHLHYPYAGLDPTGQIHPLAYFLFHQAHSFTAMYPPLFPLLCGLCYRAFGFPGLTLVPALCGLSCVLVTYATARRLGLRCRLWLIPVLGLATPLVIYASVFWDHSALMLVAALVGYWAMRAVEDGSLRSAVVAGMLIGLGVWLHEQFLALLVACWLASLPLLKSRRNLLVGLPLGFFPVILAWALFNRHVYGVYGGPHLGANVFQNNPDHPFGLAQVLDWHSFLDRAMAQLVGTTITDARPDLWPYFLTFACLLVFYMFWSWKSHNNSGLRMASVLGVTAAAVALWLVLKVVGLGTNYFPPSGLYEVTPLLIPALAVPWYVRRRQTPDAQSSLSTSDHTSSDHTSNRYYAWLSRTCFFFLVFLLVNPMNPGTDWGSRYLLTASPLLVLLAAHALERQYEMARGYWRSVAVAGAVAFVGASIVSQYLGLSWVGRNTVYGEELNAHVPGIDTTALVTDKDWLGPRLIAWPESQAEFLVRSDDDAQLLVRLLRSTGTRNFTFVGTSTGAATIEKAFAAKGLLRSGTPFAPFFRVADDSEQGDEIQMVRFNVLRDGLSAAVVGPENQRGSHEGSQSFANAATVPMLVHRYSFLTTGESGSLSDSASDSAASQHDISDIVLVGGASAEASGVGEQKRHFLLTNGTPGQKAQFGPGVFRLFHDSFTIEQWFTRSDATANDQTLFYQTLFSFSTDTSHYLIAHPVRGDDGQLSVDFNSGEGETSLRAPAPAPGVQTMLAVTYDATSEQASLYLNGAQVGNMAISDGFDLSQVAGNIYSGINGGSPFGDPSLDGTTEEFRMYRGVLTPSDIRRQFRVGPNKLIPH